MNQEINIETVVDGDVERGVFVENGVEVTYTCDAPKGGIVIEGWLV